MQKFGYIDKLYDTGEGTSGHVFYIVNYNCYSYIFFMCSFSSMQKGDRIPKEST